MFQSQLPGQEMNYFVSYESLCEEDQSGDDHPERIHAPHEGHAGDERTGFHVRKLPRFIQPGGECQSSAGEQDRRRQTEKKLGKKLEELRAEKKGLSEEQQLLEKAKEGKKEEEVPQSEKDQMEDVNKKLSALEDKRIEMLKKHGSGQKLVKATHRPGAAGQQPAEG